MGFLSLYSLFVEGTVFMVARHKDPAGVVSAGGSGWVALVVLHLCVWLWESHLLLLQGADSVWTLRSSLPRFSHRYSLSVSYRDGQSNTSGSGKLEK